MVRAAWTGRQAIRDSTDHLTRTAGSGRESPERELATALSEFCRLPFGVVSIVKASQVNGLWAGGRYAEAQASADSAKKWAYWSIGIGIGIVVFVIYGILIAAAAAVSTDFNTSAS